MPVTSWPLQICALYEAQVPAAVVITVINSCAVGLLTAMSQRLLRAS